MKDHMQKILTVGSRILTPLIKGSVRTVLSNAFEEFLVDKEREIRRSLGVGYGRPVVGPMRRLFKRYLAEKEAGYYDEDAEDEEEEEEEAPEEEGFGDEQAFGTPWD